MITNGDSSQKARNWAYIVGRWDASGSDIRYTGPSGAPGPLGIAINEFRVTDCSITVDIEFETLNKEKKDASAGIVLGYSGLEQHYVMAVLGGWERAYALGEYDPSQGWRGIASYGSILNLEAGRIYPVKLVKRGQKLALFVDNVRVYEHFLTTPILGTQVGVYAWGYDPIWFRNMEVVSGKPKLFVAMPFSEQLKPLYDEVINPRATAEGFEVVRIDEVSRPGIIFKDIQNEIADASVVVGEISEANGNVLYELGYAHALNKPTILLARRGQKLPFDISSYRVIFYDDSIAGKPALDRSLTNHLQSILNEP